MSLHDLIAQGARRTAPRAWLLPTQVAAWRCRGRVPLGADIHACLAEIQLRCEGLQTVKCQTKSCGLLC